MCAKVRRVEVEGSSRWAVYRQGLGWYAGGAATMGGLWVMWKSQAVLYESEAEAQGVIEERGL